MQITNYRRGGQRHTDEPVEVVVWYKVPFVHGPRHGEYKWFPGPLEPYLSVPGQLTSSQYKLVRVLVVERWRSYYSYEYHYPSR